LSSVSATLAPWQDARRREDRADDVRRLGVEHARREHSVHLKTDHVLRYDVADLGPRGENHQRLLVAVTKKPKAGASVQSTTATAGSACCGSRSAPQETAVAPSTAAAVRAVPSRPLIGPP